MINADVIEIGANLNNSIKSSFNLKSATNWSQLTPFEFWKELGNPKYVCAPMVDQSELAFRIICRKYGTDLTYTPMIHSVLFATQEKYREQHLKDISLEEQPCFLQFCGHDPEMLLRSGKLVEDKTPCFDLNLGCPQGIAKRGYYGSFLLENTDLVLKILGYLSNNLKCGVSCKIRLFPDLSRTFDLVQNLEKTGIKVLTVHGRTKQQNKESTGNADWDAIRKIKSILNIPVIANGGIECYEDVQRCFDATNCDAVMSAEKLLENPFFFSGYNHNVDDVALEYLDIAKELNTDISQVRSHLYKLYYHACKLDMSYNHKLGITNTHDDFLTLGEEIKEFRKNIPNEEKFGWYKRYRNSVANLKETNEKEQTCSEDFIYDFNSMFG